MPEQLTWGQQQILERLKNLEAKIDAIDRRDKEARNRVNNMGYAPQGHHKKQKFQRHKLNAFDVFTIMNR
jgi:hypothetical protein